MKNKQRDRTFSEVMEDILVAHMSMNKSNVWKAERGLAYTVNNYAAYMDKKTYVYNLLLTKNLMIYKWKTYRLNFAGMWIAKMIMEKKLSLEIVAHHKYSGNFSEKDKIVYNRVINKMHEASPITLSDT